VSNHRRPIALALVLGGVLACLAPALAADLLVHQHPEVVVEKGVHHPVALVDRVDVVAVTPRYRYVVYEDAPAYLFPVYAPHPPVVVRVPRYFPRGVRYNRPSHLPPLKRCLC
jgi:hypothetical protein